MRPSNVLNKYGFSESLESKSCLRRYATSAIKTAVSSQYETKGDYLDYGTRGPISSISLTFDHLRYKWLDKNERFEEVVNKNIDNLYLEIEDLNGSSIMMVHCKHTSEDEPCMVSIDRDKEEFNIIFPFARNIANAFLKKENTEKFSTGELRKLKSDDIGHYIEISEECASCKEWKSKLYFPELVCENCKKKEIILDNL